MKNHLKILGIFYLAFGLLGVIVAILLFNTRTGHLQISGWLSLIANTSGYASVIALIFAAESLPAVITGIALIMQKFWARMLALALGFVNLFLIPLGTALGVYTIWVLVNNESNSETVDEAMLPRVFPPYH